MAIAFSGLAAHGGQDGLWQPQVRAIIGADNHGANAALEGFVPLKQTAESVLFLDVRAKHDFEDGFGQDIGLGIRRIVNPDLMVGGYAYVNVQNFDSHHFTGATLGAEAVTPNFDAHVNVYLPIGGDATSHRTSSSLSLVGNQLLEQISTLDRRNYAAWGIEGEIGAQLPIDLPDNHSLRLDIGAYHFDDPDGRDGSVTGGKAGFEYSIGNAFGSGASLTFTGEVRSDNRDNTQFAGSIQLTVPFNAPASASASDEDGPVPVYPVSDGLRKRVNERVRGDIGVRIETQDKRSSAQRVAIDAATGKAFGDFFFADGDNTLGLGTLGDPTTLDDAVAKAGSGFVVALGGKGNLLTGGVTLANGQTVIGGGESVNALLSGQTRPTAFNLGGSDGTVGGTNPANNVITLANGNVINGITITGGANGIFGNNVNGATLTNVTVTGAGANGAFFAGTSTGIAGSNFKATGNGADGLHIEGDGTYNFTGTTVLSGNGGDGLDITGHGTYSFASINALDNAGDGIHVSGTSVAGKFSTTGGTVAGNGGTGVFIDPITADVTLTSIDQDGGAAGVVLDKVSGSFTVTGKTTVANTAGAAIAISDSPASIRFGDVQITGPGGDGMSFAGVNAAVVAGNIVVSGLGLGSTGLDFSNSRTAFTAQSLAISGTGAGSIGIDLARSMAGSSIVITGGGTIVDVGTGVRFGIAGSTLDSANAEFSFGGGSIAGATASLDARGLNQALGHYAFGSTAFTGPQLFDAQNLIFVGAAATGAGTGSSLADLASIGTADANTAADAIFVLVNRGASIDDADGFSLTAGQTLASFGNGRQFSLGGVPINVTGANVANGVAISDAGGAATLTSSGGADTVTLANGTSLLDFNLSNSWPGGGNGVHGNGVTGVAISGLSVSGAGLDGVLFEGINGVSANNLTSSGNGGNGLSIQGDGAYNFTGTTQLTGNSGDGLIASGDGTYAFQTLNAQDNTGLGIDVLSTAGSFSTTTGTVSGNDLGGVVLGGLGLNVTLTSLSQNSAVGGLFGAALLGVSGNFTVNGATTTANTGIGGILIADTTAAIRFGGAVDISDVSSGGGILVQRSAGPVTFGGAVSIARTNDDAILLNDSTGPVTFSGPVDISDVGGIGIDIDGNSGAVSFGTTSVANAAVDGIDINDTAATIDFGTTTIGLGPNAGTAGIDFSGTNAHVSFGATTITGLGASQTGIDFSGSSTMAGFGLTTITGNGSATSRGIDLSSTTGNRTISFLTGSSISGAGIGVDLSSGLTTATSANATFTFGDGEFADANGRNSKITAAPGNFTVNTVGFDSALPGDYDFDDVAFTGNANLAAAPGAVTLVSQAGGFVAAGTTGNLSNDVNTISLTAADAMSAPTTFAFVGTIDLGTLGAAFSLDSGQVITGFGNANSVSFGTVQPLNVHGNLGNIGGAAITGNAAVLTGTGDFVQLFGDNTVRHTTFDFAGATGSVFVVNGAAAGFSNGGIAIEGVTVRNVGSGQAAIEVTSLDSGLSVGNNDINVAGKLLDISGGTGTIFVARGTLPNSATPGTLTGGGISITGRTGGAVNFSDQVTINGGGVSISGGTAAGAVSFNGGLDITTSAVTGLDFSGLNVLTVADAGSTTINATGQTALSLQGAIGAGGVNFDSIASTGASGQGVLISGASGGVVKLATVTVANSVGSGIEVLNSAGAYTFGNTGIDNSASIGRGINVENAASATTIVLDGTLSVSTASGTGLRVASTGAPALTQVNTSGAGVKSITTLNGSAVDIASATLGASFDGVSASFGAGNGINLQNLAGTLTINGGTLTNTGTGAAFNVGSATDLSGGNAAVAYAGVIASNGAGAAASIRELTGGSVTLSGNLTDNFAASGGNIVVANIDNGTAANVTFSGAGKVITSGGDNGISLSGNPDGTIGFTNGGLAITTGSGTGFLATGGTVNITAGLGANTIATAGGSAISLNGVTIGAGGLHFDSVSVTGAATGISLTSVSGGAIDLGTVAMTGITARGVDINTALAAPLNFASLAIGLNSSGNAVAFDLAGAAVGANITAGDFDVTNAAAPGSTTAVDLSGAHGNGIVRLGGDVASGRNASIAGVETGVLFSAATNLGVTGTTPGFVFGDGEAPAESTVSASGFAIDGVLPAAGDYDFDDVDFGVSNVSNLVAYNLYYIDAAGNISGTGNGSLANPGSVADAQLSPTANVFVLIDKQAGVAGDTIDMGAGSFSLKDGQALISFGSADGTIDVSQLGVSGVGAPTSFHFSTIQNSPIIAAPAGIEANRPTLTTFNNLNAAITLPTAVLSGPTITAGIRNVTVRNTGTGAGIAVNATAAGVSTFVLDNNDVASGGIALSIAENSAAATANRMLLSIDGNRFASNGAVPAISIAGQGVDVDNSSIRIDRFAGNTVIGNGVGGGVLFDHVGFLDAPGAGTLTIGQNAGVPAAAGDRVSGDGLKFVATTGTLNLTTLNIANDSGTGLLVDNDANNDGAKETNFTLTNSGGAVDTTNGTAMNLDPLTVAMTFGSVTATGGASGIIFDGVKGTFTVTGATSITGTTGAGISAIHDNSAGTFNFAAVTVNNAASTGGGVDWASGALTVAGLANIDTTSGAGVSQAGGSTSFSGGLTVDAASGTGIAGTGGTMTVGGSGNTISSGGSAVSLDGVTIGAGGFTFATTTSTGGANNVSLTDVTGGAVSLGGGALSVATGAAFAINGGTAAVDYAGTVTSGGGNAVNIQNRGAGAGTIALSGDITHNVGAASGIVVSSNSAGTVQFSGKVDVTTASAAAINLSGNSGGATTQFLHKGLTINVTGGGAGFVATGGKVSLRYQNPATDLASVITNTGTAIDLENVAIDSGNFQFDTANVTGAAAVGYQFTNVTGGTISIGQGNVQNTTVRTIDIDGGSAAMNFYGGTFRNAGAAGRVLEVTNRTGGQIMMRDLSLTDTVGQGLNFQNNSGGSFAGNVGGSGNQYNISVSGANNALTVVNSAGFTLDFGSGGSTVISLKSTGSGNAIDISNGAAIKLQNATVTASGTGKGIEANSGGTVTISGSATVTSATGAALDIQNTTIGSGGVTFRSVSANGAANGIVLNNTGSSGGLTVTGDGGGANNGSGGTIQNSTGDGISLIGTQDVHLAYMNITNNLGDGIGGSTVNGFVLNRMVISGNGNDAATDESGINIAELTGTASNGAHATSISNSTISNNNEFELQITNTAGTLANFQLIGNSISSNGLPINGNALSPHGNLVNFLGHGTSTMGLTVTGGSFTGNWNAASPPATITGSGVFADTDGVGMTANISGATFTNNNNAINVSTGPGNAAMTFDIENNTIVGSRSTAINVFANGNAPFNRTVNGTIRGNTVGNGTAASGSLLGRGIDVGNEGAVNMTLLIDNNTLQNFAAGTSAEAIAVNVGLAGLATAGGTTNLTITNNNIHDVLNSRALIVWDNQDTTGGGPYPTIWANISGNTFGANIAGQAGNGEFVRIKETNGTVLVTQAAATAGNTPTELDNANGVIDPTKFGLSGTVTFGAATPPPPTTNPLP